MADDGFKLFGFEIKRKSEKEEGRESEGKREGGKEGNAVEREEKRENR